MTGLHQKYQSGPRTATDNASTAPFYELYGSFLEIYNEEVIDLLAPIKTPGTTNRSGRISIREDARGEISLTGIREEKVAGGEEVMMLLQKGSLCRTTKSTEMNMVSSRSHAIFTLLLRQRAEGTSSVLCSKLHLVDLAGSERLKRTNAQGDRAKESISINSGLLALGNVISALGDESRKATHVPYRDSKLTRLLQDSLGGNAQTLMIACASPSSDNFTESLNTLRYAARAKNIKNRSQLNEESGGNGAFEIGQLKKQIAALKSEILNLRTSRRGSEISDKTVSTEANESGSELNRLRLQNADLKRKLTQTVKEKVSAEAERDFFKGAAGPAAKSVNSQQQLKLITELKLKISELEQRAAGTVGAAIATTTATNPTSSKLTSTTFVNGQPQTPIWLRQANALIDQARSEISVNVNVMKEIERASLKMAAEACSESSIDTAMDVDEYNNPFLVKHSKSANSSSSSSSSLSSTHSQSASQHVLQFTQTQFAAAVATRTSALLSKLRSDLSIKEDLIRQFEVCQAEYNSMRRSYDEKLKLMHENLQRAQKERDQALIKQRNNPLPPSSTPPGIKAKYEDRIRILGKEMNELRAKLASVNKALNTRSSAAETGIKNLTKQLEIVKNERTKLAAKLAEETARLRTDTLSQDTEIKELRQRERRAQETAVKLKKAYDFQRALLQKRIEQHQQARNKIKQLLLALRKRSNTNTNTNTNTPSLLLDSPSWRSSASELDDLEMEVDSSIDTAIVEDSTVVVNSPIVDNTSSADEDDELDLQLNAETEAVLNDPNDDLEMMEIDQDSSSQGSRKFNVSMSPSDLEFNSTGELPRSALRQSPLIARRPREGIVEDLLKKRKPFK